MVAFIRACILSLLLAASGFLVSPACSAQSSPAIDLSHAVVYFPANSDEPQTAAVQMLIDEAAKRTGEVWHRQAFANGNPPECGVCIVVGRIDQLRNAPFPRPSSAWPRGDQKHEAFRIDTLQDNSGDVIRIAGQDDRGMLYGIGYLLRHMNFAPDRATLPTPLHVISAPQFAIRGFQLGYRFKNNTYDAWTPERFEQYIRDLAVFGANTIELLPPRTDDAPSSPLFPLPAMEMMERVSALTQKYGLRCSVYYPAMAKNYADPKTVASELNAWGEIFRKLPEIDALFVPGGDPGHTAPSVLFPFLAKVAAVLHKYHPHAKIWVSAQGFDAKEMNSFYALVAARPAWLTGVVVGPQSRDGLIVERAHIPVQIPLRFYPDIAHTMQSQFPVPEWDEVFALTEGREVIDPRPQAETTIFRHYAPYMDGFVAYSEGVNDDVNKFIWASLGWSPKAAPMETLREYAHYFLGEEGFTSKAFAQGLMSLEHNWEGPIATNTDIDSTLHSFQKMQAEATPAQAANWRFQEALYRAYTDAYERHRFLAVQAANQRALEILSNAPHMGSLRAMQDAESTLNAGSSNDATLRSWHKTIEMLAGQLFKNIGIQLSVKKYGASAIDRGASLDTLDVSLNDRVWLQHQFARIRPLPSESDRLQAIAAITNWRKPGPGSFYDDLGNADAEPHLVRGPGYPTDPAFFKTALDAVSNYTPGQGWRLSQISNAGALYDNALELRYQGLSPSAHYKLRIDYAGESYTLPMTLVANNHYLLQKSFQRKHDPGFVELDIPTEATRNGMLDLKWTRPKGMGGGGRGLQVAEVWLIRMPDTAHDHQRASGATGARFIDRPNISQNRSVPFLCIGKLPGKTETITNYASQKECRHEITNCLPHHERRFKRICKSDLLACSG